MDTTTGDAAVNIAASTCLERRLLVASEIGNTSTVRKLLDKYVNPNVKDDHGICALSKATQGGHKDVVNCLLEMNATVNTRDKTHLTPLHYATRGNYCDILKVLIYHGANVNLMNKTGLRAIDMAVYRGEAWKLLKNVTRGIIPDITEPSDVPEIPSYAILNGMPKEKKKKKKKKSKKKLGGKPGKKKK